MTRVVHPRVTFRKQPPERFTGIMAPSYAVSLDGVQVASLSPHEGRYYWSTSFGGWRNTAAERDYRPLEEAKVQVREHIIEMWKKGARA